VSGPSPRRSKCGRHPKDRAQRSGIAMNLGFETCGNATAICHDGVPILCTDPWLIGQPYFGSWTHKFKLTQQQIDDILSCEFIWFSHGHPDHLDPDSIDHFVGKKILLPAHVGSRIYNDLKAQGHHVIILENDKWINLSRRIRILCLSDYYQDALLFIDINGTLLIDTNDASPRDWHGRTRQLASCYKQSFLLKLISHGDADMMNFFDDSGKRVVPSRIKSVPLGAKVSAALESYKARYYIPFSTAHQYQRMDSVWANDYVIQDFADMRKELHVSPDRVLEANITFDLERDSITETRPEVINAKPLPPEAFGDIWSDVLEPSERDAVRAYFMRIESLRRAIDFVTVRVGGVDTTIEMTDRGFRRGIIFEVPRRSLMTAISSQTFDDLLIGNFVKTTLIGIKSLYPGFTPFVSRYSDNGLAHSVQEVRSYMAQYRRRNPLAFLKHELEMKTTQRLRAHVLSNDRLLKGAYRLYKSIKNLD
jgi:hypothetical protein